MPYQASNQCQRTVVAPLGFEMITSRQIPADCDISGYIFSCVDLDFSGTDSMDSYLDQWNNVIEINKSKSDLYDFQALN